MAEIRITKEIIQDNESAIFISFPALHIHQAQIIQVNATMLPDNENVIFITLPALHIHQSQIIQVNATMCSYNESVIFITFPELEFHGVGLYYLSFKEYHRNIKKKQSLFIVLALE